MPRLARSVSSLKMVVTVPAVASKAGVSVRTVYRYFPTKQALLDDVAEIQMRRADALTSGRDDLIDDPGNYLLVLWRDFATDVEAIRAQHLSTAGSDLRHRRLEYARGEVQDRLAKAFPDTSEADRALLADLLIAIALAKIGEAISSTPDSLDDVRAAGPDTASALDAFLAESGNRFIADLTVQLRDFGADPKLIDCLV